MDKPTPGPWRIEPHIGGIDPIRVTSYIIYSDSDVDAGGREISPEDPIGEIYGGYNEKELRANALEAIAAPALREALERITKISASGPHIGAKDGMTSALAALDRARDIARAALKEGTGQ